MISDIYIGKGDERNITLSSILKLRNINSISLEEGCVGAEILQQENNEKIFN